MLVNTGLFQSMVLHENGELIRSGGGLESQFERSVFRTTTILKFHDALAVGPSYFPDALNTAIPYPIRTYCLNWVDRTMTRKKGHIGSSPCFFRGRKTYRGDGARGQMPRAWPHCSGKLRSWSQTSAA